MEIRVQEHGRHVVVLTIDNPPRLNAMTRAMMVELGRLWDELERGPCRCIVLTGAGARAFSAGADMSGDLCAAAPHARFGLPEVKWSVYPFGGATIKLVQQIGYVHAMELLFTAGLIDAAEAARIGLINRVVPAERLMPWALETAERIAANSPSAVQAVKRQISATIAEHARAREALDQALGDRVRASAHFREGVAAFREKRAPRYD